MTKAETLSLLHDSHVDMNTWAIRCRHGRGERFAPVAVCAGR